MTNPSKKIWTWIRYRAVSHGPICEQCPSVQVRHGAVSKCHPSWHSTLLTLSHSRLTCTFIFPLQVRGLGMGSFNWFTWYHYKLRSLDMKNKGFYYKEPCIIVSIIAHYIPEIHPTGTTLFPNTLLGNMLSLEGVDFCHEDSGLSIWNAVTSKVCSPQNFWMQRWLFEKLSILVNFFKNREKGGDDLQFDNSFPNTCNSQGWVNLKPGGRNSSWVIRVGGMAFL